MNATATKPETFTLRNWSDDGVCIKREFTVHGNTVTVAWVEPMTPRYERTMSRAEARVEYGRLLRCGWKK